MEAAGEGGGGAASAPARATCTTAVPGAGVRAVVNGLDVFAGTRAWVEGLLAGPLPPHLRAHADAYARTQIRKWFSSCVLGRA